MPEGPEIRRSADALADVLDGHEIVALDIGLATLTPYKNLLINQRVDKVTSWGKAMLIYLRNGYTIYSHNQLYGLWHVATREECFHTKRSLRLGLYTDTHSAELYSASDISVWSTDQLKRQPLLSKLGPDVLSPEVTLEIVRARLTHKKFNRRRVSGLYLDQSFMAGLGNYLRSEILFWANIHPSYRPCDLSLQQLELLSKWTVDIPKRSYLTGGYTVDDDSRRNAFENNDEFEMSRFMVFDRAGSPCRLCHTVIAREIFNGRRLYFCPHCQSR